MQRNRTSLFFKRDSFIGFLIVLSQIVRFEIYFCGRFSSNRAQNVVSMDFVRWVMGGIESNACNYVDCT